MSAVLFSSCQAAARSSESRVVAEDSALFVATVRVLRDSVKSPILVLPEPLPDGSARVGSKQETAIRDWRERWLRSAGLLSASNYEPCTGIFVIGRGKAGCPATQLELVRISRVSDSREGRALTVTVRSVAPSGSSEMGFRYVFSRRGDVWTLMAVESGPIIE